LALLIITVGGALMTVQSLPATFVLTFGLVAVISSVSGKRIDVVAMSVGYFALCITATLLWWGRALHAPYISPYALVFFFFVAAGLIHLFRKQGPTGEVRSPVIWILVYSCLAAWLTFSTGIFDGIGQLRKLWRHWGAYVGPAELLQSGAAIFHDFPAQYGLGPTALIAGFCGPDCWHAMYFVAGFATLAYSILIAVMALALTRDRWWIRITVLILCLAVCFFWSGSPDNLSSPMTTPSVSGMRFLPAAVLLTFLFFAEDIGQSKAKVLVAQALWMLGVLWSPESAFYVTFLWWPYYLFVRRAEGGLKARVRGIMKPAANLLAALVLLVLAFVGIYWLVYQETPTLYGIFAYAINPPGPLPIKWNGAVWFFLSVMVIGLGTSVYSFRKTGDTTHFRRGYLVLLASYGATSYFLGRSQDNNLLNIMPLFLLVILNAMSAAQSKVLWRTSVVLAVTLLAWLPFFEWQAWQHDLKDGGLFEFDSHLDSRFGMHHHHSGEVWRAIYSISRQYHEPITVLSNSYLLLRAFPPHPWSAINGPENFAYIPSERRREFVVRTAASLKRTGWVVVARDFPADEWLADFDAAYRRDLSLDFGSYYAIRYIPKVVAGSSATPPSPM
jgi:hypothetical protein